MHESYYQPKITWLERFYHCIYHHLLTMNQKGMYPSMQKPLKGFKLLQETKSIQCQVVNTRILIMPRIFLLKGSLIGQKPKKLLRRNKRWHFMKNNIIKKTRTKEGNGGSIVHTRF